MHAAGHRSWSLSQGDDPLLTTALLVRDTLGLVVAAEDVPPPVTPPPPARPADDLTDAWLHWWRDLIRLVVEDHADRAPDDSAAMTAWATAREARRRHVGQPLDGFGALAGTPELQDAARAVDRSDLAAAHEDAFAARSRHLGALSDVVAQVSAERGVDPSSLHGTVVHVPAPAHWWQPLAPGLVLASIHLPTPDAARAAWLA
ncbi:hypothetical protein [Cellulomonas oligotrophica]|uniref:Uncharacterized protein n=1 Tax=Cellulomonas oligotrophica TaxID=931536 RepID=A0A7Y9FFU4_9CELL|nr:hypothetical protein [Cellulomonas oligotrophica]NYD86576.1 hypothetical protein [Cellulomonas oligotrophica]GIG32534.1 hypothetical protein Col01nite_16930 [Cellulomonas oligotrophica]